MPLRRLAEHLTEVKSLLSQRRKMANFHRSLTALQCRSSRKDLGTASRNPKKASSRNRTRAEFQHVNGGLNVGISG